MVGVLITSGYNLHYVIIASSFIASFSSLFYFTLSVLMISFSADLKSLNTD